MQSALFHAHAHDSACNSLYRQGTIMAIKPMLCLCLITLMHCAEGNVPAGEMAVTDIQLPNLDFDWERTAANPPSEGEDHR